MQVVKILYEKEVVSRAREQGAARFENNEET